ncbi:MAG: phosphatidate cytidylyltransferase [Candidatus Obscuribacterales bacterium]|nr:phosphatidate cytidylyltransferase [Candidatus Obscuribacterales bacterium]
MGIIQSGLSTNDCAAKTLYVLGSIFLFSALLIWWRPIFRKGVADAKLQSRFLGFAMIALFVFIPCYLGGFTFVACIAAMVLECLLEFYRILNLEGMGAYKKLALVLGVLLVGTAAFASAPLGYLVPGLAASAKEGLPSLFYVMPAGVVAAVFALPLFSGKPEGALVRSCVTIFSVIYIAWFLGHMILLRNLPNGFGYFVFFAMCVAMNDIFAYLFGKFFGKNQMIPGISPAKTWEGFIGGICGSLLAALVFFYSVSKIEILNALVLALLISITAPLGDLVISMIKRDMKVKDCGTILPGHGGLLDRVDSAILTSPVIYYYLLFSGNG